MGTHFSQFIAAGVGCDDLEELYCKVHVAIKEDPTAKATEKKVPELTQDLKALRRDVVITDSEGNTKFICRNKRSKQQREDRIKQLKAHTLAKIAEEECD